MCKPEKGRQRPLEGTDFWNLAGRAGRLRREFQGNIFLIDYDEWKAKPLDQERDSEIVPALQDGVTHRLDELVATMADERGDARKPDGDLETLFIRLLDDHSRGELPTTMSRLTASGVLYTVPSFGISNQKSARFGRQGIESRFLEHAAVAALDAASLVLEAMLAMPGQKSRMRTLERSLRRDGKAGTVDQ